LGSNDVFVPRILARPEASSPVDCLSEYAQIRDGSWRLPLSTTEATNVTEGVATFQECVDLCSTNDDCLLLTFGAARSTHLSLARFVGGTLHTD
jgi:hypothetical protein